MFHLHKISGSFRVPVARMKQFISDSILDQEGKSKYLDYHLRKELATYYNSTCGVYVGFKNLKVLKICEDGFSYLFTRVSFLAQVYFYKVEPKEIIDFKVTKIYPTVVEGQLYNAKVQIPKSQLSNSIVVYTPANNCFQIGREKIKEGDVIRAKVTSVITEKDFKRSLFYKIKGSCRNVGTGKIS